LVITASIPQPLTSSQTSIQGWKDLVQFFTTVLGVGSQIQDIILHPNPANNQVQFLYSKHNNNCRLPSPRIEMVTLMAATAWARKWVKNPPWPVGINTSSLTGPCKFTSYNRPRRHLVMRITYLDSSIPQAFKQAQTVGVTYNWVQQQSFRFQKFADISVLSSNLRLK
jgi:hypothetical protein